MSRLRTDQKGFSMVEAVLVVVIVAAIAGVGLYVMKQKQQTNKTVSSNSAATHANPPQGTSASVDQLTQQDAQTEAGVDHAADNQTGQDATSANSAVSNLGGAYNETSL